MHYELRKAHALRENGRCTRALRENAFCASSSRELRFSVQARPLQNIRRRPFPVRSYREGYFMSSDVGSDKSWTSKNQLLATRWMGTAVLGTWIVGAALGGCSRNETAKRSVIEHRDHQSGPQRFDPDHERNRGHGTSVQPDRECVRRKHGHPLCGGQRPSGRDRQPAPSELVDRLQHRAQVRHEGARELLQRSYANLSDQDRSRWHAGLGGQHDADQWVLGSVLSTNTR